MSNEIVIRIALPSGVIPTIDYSEGSSQRQAEQVLWCPVHRKEFTHKKGTSQSGRPYHFYKCPVKDDSGWCQEAGVPKPQDVHESFEDIPL